MRTLRAALAVILIFYSVPTLLSGFDIYGGQEPDLSSEWIIVGLFFVLSILFILVNLIELIRVRK